MSDRLADGVSLEELKAAKLLKEAGYILIPPHRGICALPECGKAFSVPAGGKVGRPRHTYCCDAHRIIFHKRGGVERIKRWRARNKK